jgi:hypothetical protein
MNGQLQGMGGLRRRMSAQARLLGVRQVLRHVRGKPRPGDQEDEDDPDHEDPELERRVPSKSDALEALF